MPESIEWLGLTAVYSKEELALMADLKAGVGAGEVDRRELEVLHELKSLCRAHLVDWMEPQAPGAWLPGAPVTQGARQNDEAQNDERVPQRRYRRHEALDGQVSFFG